MSKFTTIRYLLLYAAFLGIQINANAYDPIYPTIDASKNDPLYEEYIACLTKESEEVLADWRIPSERSGTLPYTVDHAILEEVLLDSGKWVTRLTVSGQSFPSTASIMPTLTVNDDQATTGSSYSSSLKIHFIFTDQPAPRIGDKITFSFGPANTHNSVLLTDAL